MDEQEWLAERFEGPAHPPPGAGLPDARLAERGRRRAQEAWLHPIVGRSPAATRQLASRARRRVLGAPVPNTDLSRQREVVDAFFAAGRDGDFDKLVAVLDPDLVLCSDGGAERPGLSVLGQRRSGRRPTGRSCSDSSPRFSDPRS